ncbi:nitroreductase family protein [Vibrio sp.]|nr:nitroreductase family protein [Vibrio sp.]
MTHPIISDLSKRYTVKKYDATKKVSSNDLATVLEALRLSASSINSQPWKFVVIESDAAKQRFHETFANKFQFNQSHAKEASHVILFAHKEVYQEQDYDAVLNKQVIDGRLTAEKKADAFAAYGFVKMNEDEKGQHAAWTKNQTYIALGNALHTLARLNIDSTTMEGIDRDLIKEKFADELAGYDCHVALAIGYHHTEDRNATAPKSRLATEDVVTIL